MRSWPMSNRKALRPRPEFNGGLHHRARAKRVVQLFMSGAASQCDTFDYKPALIKKNGQKFDPGGKVELFQSEPGAVMASPWNWRQYGQCGQWISDLVPHLATASTTSRSCRRWSPSRTCTARRRSCRTPASCCPGFPSMGAWVSYGLGSLNQNLPTFVVLPDSRGFAPNGPANWSAGFLPAAHQGTMVRPGAKNPIFDLFPPEEAELDPRGPERRAGALESAEPRARSRAAGRLAARGPHRHLRAGRPAATERPEVLDLSRESAATEVALRAGRADHRRLRPQLPDRPPAAGARRAVRAGLERRRQRLPAPQLGLARRHRPRPRRRWPRAWTSPPPP